MLDKRPQLATTGPVDSGSGPGRRLLSARGSSQDTSNFLSSGPSHLPSLKLGDGPSSFASHLTSFHCSFTPEASALVPLPAASSPATSRLPCL